MNKLYTTLILFFAVTLGYAQNGCTGARYVDEIFTEVSSTTMKFGENYTYGGQFQELFMDVYEPVGDTRTDRPVVVFAFGGAFITGDRSQVQGFCEEFARKGYVAAAIDYRIYAVDIANIPDSLGMLDIITKSIGDMKAAVRMLRKSADDGNPYGINPDFVFTGGLSAGAITAMHVAQLGADDTPILPDYVTTAIENNGGWEGDTDDPDNSAMSYSSDVQGVVSYLGALHRRAWLDSDDVPFISIHGTADDVVPYGHGTVTLFGLNLGTLEGSSVLHAQADEVGITNQFISVPGGDHGSNFPDNYWSEMSLASGSFLRDIVCEGILINNETVDNEQFVTVFPNPVSDKINIETWGYGDISRLEIYNSMGQLVQQISNISSNNTSFDRPQMPAGMYVVQVHFADADITPVNNRVIFR